MTNTEGVSVVDGWFLASFLCLFSILAPTGSAASQVLVKEIYLLAVSTCRLRGLSQAHSIVRLVGFVDVVPGGGGVECWHVCHQF